MFGIIDEYICFSKHIICVIWSFIGRSRTYNNTNIKIEISPILSVKYTLNTGNFTRRTAELCKRNGDMVLSSPVYKTLAQLEEKRKEKGLPKGS